MDAQNPSVPQANPQPQQPSGVPVVPQPQPVATAQTSVPGSTPPQQQPQQGSKDYMRKMGKPLIIVFSVVAVLIGAMAGAYVVYRQALVPKNYIIVDDQKVVDSVKVKQLTISKTGFLVIQVFTIADAPQRITNSALLPPDTYEDFSLPLYEQPDGGYVTIPTGAQLIAILVPDINGNSIYDEDEFPIVDENGDPLIRHKFRAL